MWRFAQIAEHLTILSSGVNKDRDNIVPMVVVTMLEEEDSNQHRRVEIGQLRMPMTVTI